MKKTYPDLWNLRGSISRLRLNAERPILAEWYKQWLAKVNHDFTDFETPPANEIVDARVVTLPSRDLALAALLTGRPELGEKAVALIRSLIAGKASLVHWCHNGMYPRDNADLITSVTTQDCVQILSWLGPELDDESAGLLYGFVRQGGEAIWRDIQTGCWWANALNSNWTSCLNLGLFYAALIVQVHDPDTAAPWLAYARDRMIEMMDLAQAEGAGVEGAGYWVGCFLHIQNFVEALYHTTGENLWEHPLWSRTSRFLPYLVLPDWSGFVNYADTGTHSLNGTGFFHAVAARTRDPLAQWFANRILRLRGETDFTSLHYYDPEVEEQPLDGEPACRLFSSIHLASWRSGWDKDAVFMLFKGGSNAWSHTHLDLNSFLIYAYGEELAVEPGPAPYSLHYWHSIVDEVSTKWHNCIVVDGGHQRMAAQYAMSYNLEEAGDCYSCLSDSLSSDFIEMISGDASTAYGDTLERAVRDVIYLKPDVFVIYDDLRTNGVRCQRNIEWMLHSGCPLIDGDGEIVATGERSGLHIQPVFPEGWEHKHIKGKETPKDHRTLHCISIRPYWYHKWNVNPARSPYPHWDSRGDSEALYPRDYHFLMVLQVVPAGQKPRFTVEDAQDQDFCGVSLTGDGEHGVIIFNPDGRAVEFGGVETDAEKAVVLSTSGGTLWAVVRGTNAAYKQDRMLSTDSRTSQTG
jgi:hypothetical protein